MKRFWLVAAVGVLAALTAALGGSTAYGGSSSASAAAPIKLGVLTPLTGNFAPWGIQVRAGMALAVNEINRSGGVKGRGQGRLLNLVVADDQSTNTNAAIDGFRRLTQQEGVVSVGGIIGSPIALATSRLAEEAKVPLFLVKAGNNEILTQSSRYTFRTCLPSAAMVAISVVQLAQRRGLTSVGVIIADYAWGQSFKSSLEDAAKAASNIKFNVQVAPLPTTNFTPYLRALGDVSLARGDGASAGRGVDPRSGRAARDQGAGGGCLLAVLAHREERRDGGVRRLERLQVHGHGDEGVQGAREALPAGVPAERSSSRTTRSPATPT